MNGSPRLRRIVAFLLLATPSVAAAVEPAAPLRLDRRDLLLYHDDDGAVRRGTTPAEWRRRRAEIIHGMEEVMGPFPGVARRGPTDVRIEEEVDCGDHVRRRISYATEPAGRGRGFLLVPKAALDGGRKCRAVLCLHGTDDTVGARSVVEEGHRTNRTYALELVRRGYVTLAVSYPLLADNRPDLGSLGYASGTMKAIWDNSRGLDVLDSLPFVAGGRYAAIGHSLGGHNAVFTAAFDDRIVAVVSNCGLDCFPDYRGGDPTVWERGRGWCQDRYMPRLAAYRGRLAAIPFDFPEVVAAIAPRRVLVIAPMGDDNFGWRSVDEVARAARPVFALHDAADALRVAHPDCGHDFPPAVREQAYAWIDAAFTAAPPPSP